MGNYGTHPTRYGKLSDEKLYEMTRLDVYAKLSDSEKLDYLQEVVNRDAAARGMLGAPRVEYASLSSSVKGNASQGVIQVNYDMAAKGQQAFTYNGQTMLHAMDDYNVKALNTVLHENTHCLQEQIIDGTVQIPDSSLTVAYRANSFTSTAVLQDGSYRMGSQYLNGGTPGGYYMYYFQATERDAFAYAETRTRSILQDLTEKHGTEPSFAAYRQGLTVNGYQAMEQRAGQLYGNPNFEKDLNQVLQNQYFGTNVPVDPNTERAVKSEMVSSYQELGLQNGKQFNTTITEETKMGFDPKPVSMEEYDQTLREGVNSFYEHAMNDPNMSQTEAIGATAEVAENYLDALDEFQGASAEAQVGAEEGIDFSEDLDGEGIDGSMDL